MLEGLEVSEVSYLKSIKNKKFFGRFEAEFFKKEYVEIFKKLFSKKYAELSDLVFLTDGDHGNAITSENGYAKYYGARNVLTGILTNNNVEYINEEHHRKIIKSKLYENDILISCVGANIGYAAIVPPDIKEANIVRNVALLRTLNPTVINNEVLLAYFLSDFGKVLFARMATGNAQPLVSLEYIKTIPVFIPNSLLQNEIKSVVQYAINKLNQSKSLYTQAEELLLEELGLKDWQPSTENINNKSFKESFLATGRLDAEYYQPKYEAYSNKINSYKKGYKLIKEEFDHIIYSPQKIKEGYNYIEIGDVNTSDGTNSFNFIKTEELPANAKILVKKGDLLVSKVRPYRGAVTIIESDKNDILVSGAFTVLRSKEKSVFSNEVLKVILRLDIYKDWLLQFNIGTQYPVIKDEDVLNLPIPMLDQKIQLSVKERISKSQLLKQQSEHLLEVAKRAVEIAIEEDEEVAMEYINQNQ